MFDDLAEANRKYQATFQDSGLPGRAARGLAVLTCIDSRIDPLTMLGLRPGDAKILRNAGARATDDALRSLVLATNLLGVNRICLVQHTECAMIGATEAEMKARIEAVRGRDATGWTFMATVDQVATLRQDIEAIRACDLLPTEVALGGFIFDVRSGALRQVVDAPPGKPVEVLRVD